MIHAYYYLMWINIILMQIESLKQSIISALEDIKAENIVSLDVRKITSIADYMIICSARSTRHLKAVADTVTEKIKAKGVPPLGSEGDPNSGWIIIDFVDIIVHVMLPEIRTFYNLEKLWSTA